MSSSIMFHTTEVGEIEQKVSTHSGSTEEYGVMTFREEGTQLDIFLTKETVDALLDNVKCLDRRLNKCQKTSPQK